MTGRRHHRRVEAGVAALAAVALLAGCGAKTDLWMPDVDEDLPCYPQPLALLTIPPDVVFLVDRSGSMNWALVDDNPALPGELSRWQLLEQALAEVLAETDPTMLRVGAKFFPNRLSWVPGTLEPDPCLVVPGLDLEPAPGMFDRLLSFFRSTRPVGGTPTADGLEEVRLRFAGRPRDGGPRFVVLATDGGPNCNEHPEVPPPDCVCTGTPYMCDPRPVPDGAGEEVATRNCLDEARTIEQIDLIFGLHGVPVFVIGIFNPSRPELLAVLDRMAVAGGRPRSADGGRRFYNVREPADLRGALDSITSTILRCVFRVYPAGPEDPTTVRVTIDGREVRHDHLRDDGWDFTNEARTELTLFGAACEEMRTGEREPAAIAECPG